MLAKVQKWGNSQGLRIAKHVLEDAGIEVGDEVEVEVRGGEIVVGPTKRVRGRYRLEDLVSMIPEDYRAAEVDWGESVGREAW